MTPEAQAAIEMRDRCVDLLRQRIRDWLAKHSELPEREQIGYPPYYLLEAATAIEQLPVGDVA